MGEATTVDREEGCYYDNEGMKGLESVSHKTCFENNALYFEICRHLLFLIPFSEIMDLSTDLWQRLFGH